MRTRRFLPRAGVRAKSIPVPKLAHLPRRAVLAVSGEDRVSFLQGLVSNDVASCAPSRPAWAALLTPQGKYIADFFIRAAPASGRLLLDCEEDAAGEIVTRLTRYRLRARVAVERTEGAVHAAWDGAPSPGLDAEPDERLPDAGWRVLAPAPLAGNASADDYDRHRLRLGLPDGARDLEPGKSVLLEAGFDELGGVSWTKGCYMGQELTARTRYRGLVKRRLVPVELAGDGTALPAPGTPLSADGLEAGTMRSGNGAIGLANLRVGCLRGAVTAADGTRLVPRIPGWMRLPADESVPHDVPSP